jgi:O-antigen/teichoic acid export membrane protein
VATARTPVDNLPTPQSLERSSTGLLAGKAAQMGLGYLFWLVAARTASPHEVGLASGVVAGAMIVTQVSILGVGAAVILRLPRASRASAVALVDAALSLVALAALLGGAGYLAVMVLGSEHLAPLLSRPTVAVVVVAGCIAGTLALCLDSVSTALARGWLVLPRDLTAGLAGVVGLLVATAARSQVSASVMVTCWALGLALSFVLGLQQLHTRLGYRPRIRLGGPWTRPLLRDGVPNQVLTVTERVPALLLPVLLAGWVSPTLGAYWYPVWMMAWAVFLAPVSVGLAQFAADVRGEQDAATAARAALRWSLRLGVVLALGVATLAGELLGLLGPQYATEGTTPLRVLLLALPGTAVIQAYYATCRARRRIPEAVTVGAAVGLLACGGAVVGAATTGLVAAAGAWVAAQTLGGLVAGARLLVLLHPSAPTEGRP